MDKLKAIGYAFTSIMAAFTIVWALGLDPILGLLLFATYVAIVAQMVSFLTENKTPNVSLNDYNNSKANG